MNEKLKGLSKEDRYNLFINHVVGGSAELFEKFSSQKTLGEMLILVAYLNAALVTQLSSAEVQKLADLTMDFGRVYPELVARAGGPTRPGQVVMVVPLISEIDYSIPPNIEDYLTPEELHSPMDAIRGNNFSNKATPKAEAKSNPLLSKDISKTIQ